MILVVNTNTPSLICDLQELYRYLVDDLVIQFWQGLKGGGFTVKSEMVSRRRKVRREYSNGRETRWTMKELKGLFELKVAIPLIRYRKKHRIETLRN